VSNRDAAAEARYALRVNRTDPVSDAQLLEEAVRLSGERIYSRAVERALEDLRAREAPLG